MITTIAVLLIVAAVAAFAFPAGRRKAAVSAELLKRVVTEDVGRGRHVLDGFDQACATAVSAALPEVLKQVKHGTSDRVYIVITAPESDFDAVSQELDNVARDVNRELGEQVSRRRRIGQPAGKPQLPFVSVQMARSADDDWAASVGLAEAAARARAKLPAGTAILSAAFTPSAPAAVSTRATSGLAVSGAPMPTRNPLAEGAPMLTRNPRADPLNGRGVHLEVLLRGARIADGLASAAEPIWSGRAEGVALNVPSDQDLVSRMHRPRAEMPWNGPIEVRHLGDLSLTRGLIEINLLRHCGQ